MSRAKAWTVDLYRAMLQCRTFELSAQTAFWLFFSLIPLLAVAGLVAARLTQDNWERLAPIMNALPSSTRDLVNSELSTVARWNGGTVGIASAAVFVWSASSGVHALFDALESGSGTRRTWGKKRLLAVVSCLFLSIAVALLAIILPGLGGVLRALASYLPHLDSWRGEPTLTGTIGRVVSGAAVLFAYTSALYFVGVPRDARAGLPIFRGAIVAVVLEGALAFGYSLYVSRMGAGAAYGRGLTVIGLTLMTLYLFVVALLTGALVNRTLSRHGARPECTTERTEGPERGPRSHDA